MNILFLSEFFPDFKTKEITGGVEARVFFLAKELSKKHNIFVLTSGNKGQKRYEDFDNIKIIRIGPRYSYANYKSIIKRLFFSLSLVLNVKEIVRKYKIDVIDTQSFYTYPIILRRFKQKVFLTIHEVWLRQWVKNIGSIAGIFGEFSERIMYFLIRISKVKVISVSNFTKNKLNNIGIEDVTVVNNGIEINKYEKVSVSKYNNPTIISIGRLIPQKRIEDLLYAISIVKKKMSNIKLKIVGQGEDKNKLKKTAKKLKIEKNVEFLGYLKDHEEVIITLKKSHLFVSGSLREGFGIVLLESAACSVPYIASDIEPFVEVTKNGKGGLIFRRKNYYELADKILELLRNKNTYNKKVNECKELVEDYDWKKIGEELENLYKSV